MTSLAHRLYIRMLLCPCRFRPACAHCQIDFRAISANPEVFSNLAEMERNFRADMRQVEEGIK